MARAIWSGHISFGLVSIPVGVHAALESAERVHFRMLHRKDMAPIKYKKFCSKEDEEVPNDEIVKGYEVSKGKYKIVEAGELDEVQEEVGEGDRVINIVQFVEFSSLNPLLFEKPYYVAPQKGGAKPYALLRDALREARKVGIAQFYLRTRPLLAALVPSADVLSLEVIRLPSELRATTDLEIPEATVRAPERQMALQLIDSMTGEWDPTEHPNTYRKALEKLLATKREVSVGEEGAPEKSGKVVDLMEALRESISKRAPARVADKTKPRKRKSA